jgi:hypothetical protein
VTGGWLARAVRSVDIGVPPSTTRITDIDRTKLENLSGRKDRDRVRDPTTNKTNILPTITAVTNDSRNTMVNRPSTAVGTTISDRAGTMRRIGGVRLRTSRKSVMSTVGRDMMMTLERYTKGHGGIRIKNQCSGRSRRRGRRVLVRGRGRGVLLRIVFPVARGRRGWIDR